MKQIVDFKDLIGKKVEKAGWLSCSSDIFLVLENGEFCLITACEEYGDLTLFLNEKQASSFDLCEMGLVTEEEWKTLKIE